MNKVFIFLVFVISNSFLIAQGNSGIDIAIENVQFPDSVTINETAIISGYLKNKGQNPYNGNIALNFDIEDVLPIDFDVDSETDEIENLPNTIIMPGDSMYFQRSFIIDPIRFNDKTIDLIVIWPTIVVPDDNVENNRKVVDFYVEELTTIIDDDDDTKNGPNGNGNAYGYNNGNAYGHNNGNNGSGNGRLSGFSNNLNYIDIVNYYANNHNYFQIQLENNFLITHFDIFDIQGRMIKSESLNLDKLHLPIQNFSQPLFIQLSILNTKNRVIGKITFKL